MSEITNAVDHKNLDRAIEVEKVHYDTVVEQITEGETRIASLQQSINLAREEIARTRANLSKLRKRRRIFARARFELQQVNEE